ncbi:MAG: TIR and AAA domain-containing protein [Nitrospira sp.]|nr:TIR and AAA domain-containing protein [Nitrospira sp.]
MPRVFISYTHESPEHKARVHGLAEYLRECGVTVVLDRDCLPGGPDEGWDKWSEKQAQQSDVVLLVFSASYRRCWDGEQPPGVRLGASHETRVLYRRIYNAGQQIQFCRVVVVNEADKTHIPDLIAGLHVFDAERDRTDLLDWLRHRGALSSTQDQSPSQIAWPQPLQDFPRRLADRTPEFKCFEAVVTGQDLRRIFIVNGPSNRGKTVLLSELLGLVKRLGLAHSLLDCKGCPTLSDLLDRLALDVSSALFPGFHSAVGTARKSALLKDLQRLTAPLVLAFDTFQQASGDTSDWIEGQLLGRIEQCPALLVVLSGQTVPDPARHSWREFAVLNELLPITKVRDWEEYASRTLGQADVTKQHIEMLLHVSKGDPGQTSAVLQTFGKNAFTSSDPAV